MFHISTVCARTTMVSLALVLVPALVFGQSSIAGVVSDTTGAVLPGVTVEAASPVLIEKVRSVTTDNQGNYKVTDLRPGTYTVTYTLPGFSTVVREGVRLEAEFTASINIQMKIGGVEETITVTGASPIVDIQNTTRRDVLSRELIETLPTGRNYQTVMQTLPAVSAQGNVRFDVGGSTVMQQGSGAAYGGQTGDFVLMIDNMTVSTPIGQGDRPGLYINDGGFEESVYTVNAGLAEVATPGIKTNLIPKQGGNQFRGQFIGIFANGATQSTNIDQELLGRGFAGTAGLAEQFDANPSYGGPILKDRVWFFSSYRYWAYNNQILSLRNPDGSLFSDTNNSRAWPTRITTQVTQRNKFTIALEKTGKERRYSGIESGLVELKAAGWQAMRQHYYTQAKWTSTITNRMLLEAGHSFTRHDLPNRLQPEVARSETFPYGDIAKTDLVTGRQWNSSGNEQLIKWWNYYSMASLSYVTGSHAFKFGFQQRSGASDVFQPDINGSLTQRYRNGVPDSVLIRATPTDARTYLDWDLGLFVQDSWTMKRLTLNPGLRFDYFAGHVPEQVVPAGRFLPARRFAAVENIPTWSDISPRLGASFDLFGSGRTALKGSIGRYMQQEALGFIENFNPQLAGNATAARVTDTRTWRDLNGNDIAEENELGPSQNAAFGVSRFRNPNPDVERAWQMLYNVTVQHELRSGVGVSVAYNRRSFYDIAWTDNLAVSLSDYTPLLLPDPRGNGQTLTLYNLAPGRLGQQNLLDTTSSRNSRTYNGVDVTLNARFSNGATVNAGTSSGRSRQNLCELEDPNGAAAAGTISAFPRLDFCDESTFDIPILTTFKASGTYPLPWGLRLSGVFQDQPGDEKIINYSIGRAIVPTLTLATVNLRVNTPGSLYFDRVRTLDLSVAKTFVRGRYRATPKLDIFNSLNANPVINEVLTIGSALGRPTAILNPRLVRLGVVVDF